MGTLTRADIKQHQEMILNLYAEGKGTPEIGKLFSTDATAIRRVLLKHGIKLRSTRDLVSYYNPSYKRFEEVVLTEEENYFLGLLITDGCITNGYLVLSLKEEDSYMIEVFAKFLGEKVTAKKVKNSKRDSYQFEVRVKHYKLEEALNRLANFRNKSFEAYLKKSLNWTILRGIIDGDGYIRKGEITISKGSYILLKQIKDFLLLNGITTTIRKSKEKELYNLRIGGEINILKIYNKCYFNSNLHLERKRKILENYFQEYLNRPVFLDLNTGVFYDSLKEVGEQLRASLYSTFYCRSTANLKSCNRFIFI